MRDNARIMQLVIRLRSATMSIKYFTHNLGPELDARQDIGDVEPDDVLLRSGVFMVIGMADQIILGQLARWVVFCLLDRLLAYVRRVD